MPRPDAKRVRMLEVLKQFRSLVRSMREHYGEVQERSGLGGAQLWALAEIGASPGMSVGDLARQLALHLSTTSNLVRRLEGLDLVKRTRVGSDQRVVRLAVTPRGGRLLGNAPRPSVGLLQQALLELPPARLAALQRELAHLLKHMKLRDERVADELPMADILARSGRRGKSPGSSRAEG